MTTPPRARPGEAPPPAGSSGWRVRLHEIIFEADTPAGKLFDVALLVAILLSVLAVMFETVDGVRERYGDTLVALEWGLTVLFSLEYLLRLLCVQRAGAYAKSFFGIVDLLAILPAFVGLVVTDARGLAVVRALRLLRVFRVFKLARYLDEADGLRRALWISRRKITVFLTTVMVLVTILGTLMYVIEGSERGFRSIPEAIYWAVVTMTTVGYGDITPMTPLGKALAVVIMLLGYALIIVPTGILSAELAGRRQGAVTTRVCRQCGHGEHQHAANFCADCGAAL